MATYTTPTVTETVDRLKKASEEFRRDIQDNPQKARDFLIHAGIVRPSDTDPSGIELVPQLRSED